MRNKGFIFSAIILALVTAAAITWQLNCADYLDDLIYKTMPVPRALEPEDPYNRDIATIGDVAEALWIRAVYTTCRLPNLLQTAAEIIPGWITRVLHGLMIGVMLLLTSVVIGGRRVMRLPGFNALIWLLIWVFLPWNDGMASSDFVFNYVWSTVITLLFVLMFARGDNDDDIPTPTRPSWLQGDLALWVMAFILGITHEGFSVPTALGCMVWLWLRPGAWSARKFWMLVLVLAMAIVTTCNIGTAHRIASAVNDHTAEAVTGYFRALAVDSPALYFLALTLVIAWCNRKRESLSTWWRDNIIMIVAAAVALVMAIYTLYFGRGLWACYLFGIIVLGRTLLVFPFWKKPRWIIAVVCAASLIWSLGATAMMQRKHSGYFREMMRQAAASDDNAIFIDITSRYDEPWYTFGVPYSLDDQHQLWYIGTYVRKYDCPILPVFPESYRDKKVEEWPTVPGNTSLSGQFPIFASRQRLPKPTLLIRYGEALPGTSPIFAAIAAGDTDRCTYYCCKEWPVIYQGDTLWCYMLPQPRKIDRHRRITSIEYVQ